MAAEEGGGVAVAPPAPVDATMKTVAAAGDAAAAAAGTAAAASAALPKREQRRPKNKGKKENERPEGGAAAAAAGEKEGGQEPGKQEAGADAKQLTKQLLGVVNEVRFFFLFLVCLFGVPECVSVESGMHCLLAPPTTSPPKLWTPYDNDTTDAAAGDG
jgi:hypothetical protein